MENQGIVRLKQSPLELDGKGIAPAKVTYIKEIFIFLGFQDSLARFITGAVGFNQTCSLVCTLSSLVYLTGF